MSIKVNNLNFKYFENEFFTLQNIQFNLISGSRCLLIGENGSGKSTLLRILAGRHLTKPSKSIELLDKKQPFYDTSLNLERVFIDTEWGSRNYHEYTLTADIPVHSLMKQLQEDFPERREELIKILGIDLNWRMHQVSIGERCRVQLFLGLLRPSKIILLDNITICLDMITRYNLIQWLKLESQERGSTIIYATHSIDGELESWPTHIHCLSRNGTTLWFGKIEELLESKNHDNIEHSIENDEFKEKKQEECHEKQELKSSLRSSIENLLCLPQNKFVMSSSTSSPPDSSNFVSLSTNSSSPQLEEVYLTENE